MKNKKSLLVVILLVAGIVILVNSALSRYSFRIDFTSDKRYTLSKATKNILKTIDKPITVNAYFTSDLPPAILQSKNDFHDLLVEYSNKAKGKIAFQFINPNEDEKVESEIANYGIAPQIVNVREKDQLVQKKVFLAALVKYGDKKEVIPFILPGASMEYELSSAIKKLIAVNKPVVGYIQGHGEPSIYSMQQAMKALDVLYTIENVDLSLNRNLDKFKSLIIVAPTDTFPENQLALLDNYLAKGGNLYIAINRVGGDLNRAVGFELVTGLENWLSKKGITIEPKFIVDATCGNISVRQQQGNFSFTSQLSFPYLPQINHFADHPVSKGIETVVLQFASPITFNGNSSVTYSPIAFTSDKTGLIDPPMQFDIQKRWTNRDFNMSKRIVAASFEGSIAGAGSSKLVLVGDGDFAINGEGQQARQINPDNVNLMVNSIDWLSDDTGLIELRTKEITNRPLDQIKEGKRTLLKYLNFLLPVVLILLFGIYRSRRNKILEIKRMQDDFFD